MSEHTPGPWDATKSGRADGEWSITKHTWGGGSWGNDNYQVVATAKECDEVQANAHLISAAPELLAACREALDYLQNMPGPADRLCAAIAKARGA